MKPKPFVELNHFTVPLAILISFKELAAWRRKHQEASSIGGASEDDDLALLAEAVSLARRRAWKASRSF